MSWVVERTEPTYKATVKSDRRMKWWGTKRRAYFDVAVELLKELYGHAEPCPGPHWYTDMMGPDHPNDPRCAFHRVEGRDFDELIRWWIGELAADDAGAAS